MNNDLDEVENFKIFKGHNKRKLENRGGNK
jgi:hypothetical protein